VLATPLSLLTRFEGAQQFRVRLRGRGGSGITTMHGRGHAQGQLAHTRSIDRGTFRAAIQNLEGSFFGKRPSGRQRKWETRGAYWEHPGIIVVASWIVTFDGCEQSVSG
jgi:hypothetical protein